MSHNYRDHLLQLELLRALEPTDMQALPTQLQFELLCQEQAAIHALRLLVNTYGYELSAELLHRKSLLLATMLRHLNRQVENFIRYRFQDVIPVFFWGDFRLEEPVFVVNRAVVFREDPLTFEAEWARFGRQHISECVISARRQLLSLVRDLSTDLRHRPVLEPEKEEEAEEIEVIIRNREKTMISAAGQFMVTLREMSLAVVRQIESDFVNDH